MDIEGRWARPEYHPALLPWSTFWDAVSEVLNPYNEQTTHLHLSTRNPSLVLWFVEIWFVQNYLNLQHLTRMTYFLSLQFRGPTRSVSVGQNSSFLVAGRLLVS